MLYTVFHTMVNNGEIHTEAIGIFSDKETAIQEAEKWINNTKTSDVNVKRATETEWYFWYEENGNTYEGYVDILEMS